MILYNVTIKIESAAAAEWLDWMKTVHIPDVMGTGLFSEHRIYRILGDEDPAGITYAIQYLCPDLKTFVEYQNQHAQRLQQEHSTRYQGKYVAFRTLMERC
jgi:hypothetical protein